MYLHHHFNFSKLPWAAGRVLWKQMECIDLITLAITSRNTEWFSKSIVSKPIKFSVHFVAVESSAQNHWKICLEFRDSSPLIWYLYPNALKLTGKTMRLKVGKHDLLSKTTLGEDRVLHSFIVGFDKTMFEIVDWLADFFRCQVTEVNIGYRCVTCYTDINVWRPMKEARSLTIDACGESTFIFNLLAARSKLNLRTTIYYADLGNTRTLTMEQLSTLDFVSCKIGFNCLDLNFFIDCFKNVLTRPNVQMMQTRLPNWTSDQLEFFKTELNLSNFRQNLKDTHKPRDSNADLSLGNQQNSQLKMDNGSVAVFSFYDKPGNIFNILVMVVWKPLR